jgi:hypothetical protein
MAAEFSLTFPGHHQLAPAALARLGKMAKVVERYSRSVLETIHGVLLSGGAVPGWELKRKNGNRYIADPAAAYEALKDTIPIDAFLGLIDVPIGALEELWVETYQADTTKKAAREEFSRRLLRVIARKADVNMLIEAKEDT